MVEHSVAPDLAVLVSRLPARLGTLTDDVVERILAADAAYREQVPVDDLRQSVRANLAQLLDRLCVPTAPTHGYLGFLEDLTERRAEQGLSIGSLLRGFRLGAQRVWAALCEEAERDPAVPPAVLVDAAGLMWALHEATCTRAEEAYRRAEQAGALGHQQLREELLDGLLEGRAPRPSHVGAQLGLGPSGRYAVVIVEPTAGGQPDVGGLLAARGLHSAWRAGVLDATGIVALGERRLEDLAEALASLDDCMVGVSPVVPRLAEVPEARRHAATALATIPRGRTAVAVLEMDLPGALLATAPDIARLLRDRLLGPVLALEDEERTMMLQTLEAYAATGASATETAKAVACHRNTVLNRVRRYEQLSGTSLDSSEALLSTWLATRAHELVDDRPPATPRA